MTTNVEAVEAACARLTNDGQAITFTAVESPWHSWRVGLLVSNRLVVGLSGSVGRLEL